MQDDLNAIACLALRSLGVPLDINSVLGRRVRIAGHFAGVVRIEAVDDLDGAYEIRVRTEDGRLDETFLEASEVESGAIQPLGERTQLASGDDVFDLVEARRIDLAFTHDPNFAVSLSGIRGLPHQITAVYRHMLPQASVDVLRGSATDLPIADSAIDAIITDPPYYDSISYGDLSDFFYVWLKRSIGQLFPDDLTSYLTPKRREAIVAAYRHGGDRATARAFYEDLMAQSFAEGHRVLKPGAPLVVVYAHKTTLGWSTLVDALRTARFRITEAWPLDTEMTTGVKTGTSSLATSIFLVARKRDANEVGNLTQVRRELDALIVARLKRLADSGVNGADLVIATMGAALEPYTRYAAVELPNGEELPAAEFLKEVQRRVLGAILRQVHGLSDGVDAVDPATRYYVLARYSYGYAAVDFDEANNLARTAGIELADLAIGAPPLATIKKGSVTLHDYSERGVDEELGLFDGNPNRPLIDVLHGLLWRSAHSPRDIRAYLDAARPDAIAMRLVAQALQGQALRGEDDASKHPEQRACERLLGAWNTLVEDNLLGAHLT